MNSFGSADIVKPGKTIGCIDLKHGQNVKRGGDLQALAYTRKE